MKSIRHCIAAGLGLALLHSAAAAAAVPQKARARSVSIRPVQNQSPDRKDASAAVQPLRQVTPKHALADWRGAPQPLPRQRTAKTSIAGRHRLLDTAMPIGPIAITPIRRPTPVVPAAVTTARVTLPPRRLDIARPVTRAPRSDDMDRLREELSDVEAQLWGDAAPPAEALQPQSAGVIEPKAVTLKMPDLGEKPTSAPEPVSPATASRPALLFAWPHVPLTSEEAVEDAQAYLIATATPGDTMVRQGPALAIERLHPAFCVKLAEAIRQARAAGLAHAGVFSAYRPPAFGVGGFSDKFNSMHSYGLAVDMTGIGEPGSSSAHLWQSIAEGVGLHMAYGADNRAEFNHTQLLPEKIAPGDLRPTITPGAPKDLRGMWLASGVFEYVTDTIVNQVAELEQQIADAKHQLAEAKVQAEPQAAIAAAAEQSTAASPPASDHVATLAARPIRLASVMPTTARKLAKDEKPSKSARLDIGKSKDAKLKDGKSKDTKSKDAKSKDAKSKPSLAAKDAKAKDAKSKHVVGHGEAPRTRVSAATHTGSHRKPG